MQPTPLFRKPLLLFSFCLLTSLAYSQVREQWVRRYDVTKDDQPSSMVVDVAGNVYVTGNTGTLKYDKDGKELWIGTDGGSSLAIDTSGNVYVTGGNYTTIKYDNNGKELWVKMYDGPGNSDEFASTLAVDALANVYVTGRSAGVGGNSDYATVKYDTNGKELWVERYDGPGRSADYASCLAVDASGNVYVTGQSVGNGTGYDFATIKYSQTPPLLVNAGKDKKVYLLPFTPTCTFLSAHTKGGAPPNRYSWSPVEFTSSSQSTVVCPSTTTTYTVTVTDSTGEQASDQVKVNVVDARCGENKDNILVCHEGTTLCFDAFDAFWALLSGDQLGACSINPSITSAYNNKAIEEASIPTHFKVYNAPNPFSTTTRIYYELPMDGKTEVKVYDAVGRTVTTLFNGERKAGYYSSDFSAGTLSKGLYYYQVTYTTTNNKVLVKTGKMYRSGEVRVYV